MKKIYKIMVITLTILLVFTACEKGSSKSVGSLTGGILQDKSLSYDMPDSAKPEREEIKVAANYASLTNDTTNTVLQANDGQALTDGKYSFTNVEEGNYTLKVWGENISGKEIVVAAEKIIIKAGENTTKNVKLKYFTDGTGSLLVSIKLPSTTPINKITIASQQSDLLNKDITLISDDGSVKTFETTLDNIPVGSYFMAVYYKIEDIIVHSQSSGSKVQIYQGLTSNYVGSDDRDHNSLEVEFNLVDLTNSITTRDGSVGNELLDTDKIRIIASPNVGNITIKYSLDDGLTYSTYGQPVELSNSSFSVLAYAEKENTNQSEIESINNLLVKIATPILLNQNTTLDYKDSISFDKKDGYTYFYIIKDSEPTNEDVLLVASSNQIEITEPGTLYLRSERTNFIPSAFTSIDYTIKLPSLNSVSLDLDTMILSTVYNQGDDALAADVYYYTSSNTTPRLLPEDGTIIGFENGDVVSAYLVKDGWIQSDTIIAETKLEGNFTNPSLYDAMVALNGQEELGRDFRNLENKMEYEFAFLMDEGIKITPDEVSIVTHSKNGVVNPLVPDEAGVYTYDIEDDDVHQFTITLVKKNVVGECLLGSNCVNGINLTNNKSCESCVADTIGLRLKRENESVGDVIVTFAKIGDIYYLESGNDDFTYVGKDEFFTNVNDVKYDTITELQFLDSVTELPEDAFKNFSVLEKIELPATLTSIDATAFDNMNQNAKIYFAGGKDAWVKALSSLTEEEKAEMPTPYLGNEATGVKLHKLIFKHGGVIQKVEYVENNGKLSRLPEIPTMPNKFEHAPAWFINNLVMDHTSVIVGDAEITTGYKETLGANLNIETKADLLLFRDRVNSGFKYENKTILLKSNIDLNEESWTPIGTSENRFTGIFNGNNKEVSNIVTTNYSSSVDSSGFFGNIENAIIRNLNLTNGSISNNSGLAGAIVGTMNNGSVENCQNAVNVTASIASGIVGKTEGNSKILNSSNTASVGLEGSNEASGILAIASGNTRIENSTTGDNIQGTTKALIIVKAMGNTSIKLSNTESSLSSVASLDGTLNVELGTLINKPVATDNNDVINFTNGTSIKLGTLITFTQNSRYVANGSIYQMDYQIGQVGPANGLIYNKEGGKYYEVSLTDISQKIRPRDAFSQAEDFVSNGFNNWRIPSLAELNLMRTNLYQKSLGNFSKDNYWSEDKKSAFQFLSYTFNDGEEHTEYDDNAAIKKYAIARPCRDFTVGHTF